jgi:hypothetical protein
MRAAMALLIWRSSASRKQPMPPFALLHAIAGLLPGDAVVIDDIISPAPDCGACCGATMRRTSSDFAAAA